MYWISLTQAALAVLEEHRRDRWTQRPVKLAGGDFDVPVFQASLDALDEFRVGDESYSDAILRAHRAGRIRKVP